MPVSPCSQPDLSHVSLFRQETYRIEVGLTLQKLSRLASDHNVLAGTLFRLLSCPQMYSVRRISPSCPALSNVHSTSASPGESLTTIDIKVAPSQISDVTNPVKRHLENM